MPRCGTRPSRSSLSRGKTFGCHVMTLSQDMCDQLMTLECGKCGLGLTRTGSWFRSANRFKCQGCKTEARITYPDKLRLFNRAAAKLRERREPPASIDQPGRPGLARARGFFVKGKWSLN
jgi:hypothetical protein